MSGNVLLVGGDMTADRAAAANVAGRMVLFVMDRGRPSADQALRAIYLAGPKAVIMLSDADSAGVLRGVSSRRRATARRSTWACRDRWWSRCARR